MVLIPDTLPAQNHSKVSVIILLKTMTSNLAIYIWQKEGLKQVSESINNYQELKHRW